MVTLMAARCVLGGHQCHLEVQRVTDALLSTSYSVLLCSSYQFTYIDSPSSGQHFVQYFVL